MAAALACAGAAAPAQPTIGARAKPAIMVVGLRFHDLNGDGRLEPYEDWRLAPEARAADLVRRMTLEEKAGQMVHPIAPFRGNDYDQAATGALIAKGVGNILTRLTGEPGELGRKNDALQRMAEATRLGVPLIVSTDPRNHFEPTIGMSTAADGFSVWPGFLGLAAIDDPALTRRMADAARQEYRAAGIQMALSPQADLATEPRWPRISGTFGEDAGVAARQVKAYVQGMQGGEGGLARDGVAAVVKHWTGYGAAKDGWDSHNAYGQHAAQSQAGFDYQLRAWAGAFEAGAAGVMPTYSIIDNVSVGGRPLEPVGGGFSRQLVGELLRGRYGFRGLVISDWAIVADCPAACRGGWKEGEPPSIGMPWGVEALTAPQRLAKAVNAGVDEIGGAADPRPIVQAVRAGLIARARLDQAVQRILVQKFALGLFEDAYADPALAARVKAAGHQAEADRAQSRSVVVLENRDGLLPLRPGRRVYLKGVAPEAARARGLVPVATLAEADLAIVRIATPFQRLHPGYFFGSRTHEGDLDFKDGDEDLAAVEAAAARVPTVVAVYLDRPAILTRVKDRAAALVADFGISDGPLLDALAGRVRPEGRLPFELPSSMAEVRAQRPDLPHDTLHPLYPFGFRRGP